MTLNEKTPLLVEQAKTIEDAETAIKEERSPLLAGLKSAV